MPYLRGFGPTRFVSEATPRSGEQAALGADLARRLDYSKQRVSYNVKRLRRDGYVDLAAEGRVLRLTTKGSMTLADQDTAEGDAWSPPSGS